MIVVFGGGGIAEAGILPHVPDSVIVPADVTRKNEVRAVFETLRPTAAINCAGISDPGPLGEAAWETEIAVNLVGSFNIAEAAEGCGTLIYLASVAGLYGKPNHAGYSASKAGVISLVRSLAMEGVDAYAVSPGRVNTKMREKDYPGEDPRTRLEPAQVGGVIADILAGHYTPGDNIIIRKIGYDTHLRVDKGAPWREWLRVGQPALR